MLEFIASDDFKNLLSLIGSINYAQNKNIKGKLKELVRFHEVVKNKKPERREVI